MAPRNSGESRGRWREGRGQPLWCGNWFSTALGKKLMETSQVWGETSLPRQLGGKTTKTSGGFGIGASTPSSLSREPSNTKKMPVPFRRSWFIDCLFPCPQPGELFPALSAPAVRLAAACAGTPVLSLKPNRTAHTEDGLRGSPFHFFNPAQSPLPPLSLPFPQGTLLYPLICSHSLSLCVFAHTADPAFIWKT